MILVPDVHGCSDLLWQVICSYPQDHFVFLGDLIDRGPDSPEVIAQVRQLHAEGRATVLRGNHEDMMIRGVKYQEEVQLSCWVQNGGDKTIEQYANLGPRFSKDLEWLDEHLLHWVSVDTPGGKLLCAHASRPDAWLLAHTTLQGDRMLSMKGQESHLWHSQLKTKTPLAPGFRASVHGHVPMQEPRFTAGAYYLDLGACKSGQLAVMDTTSMTHAIFNSDRG